MKKLLNWYHKIRYVACERIDQIGHPQIIKYRRVRGGKRIQMLLHEGTSREFWIDVNENHWDDFL